MPQAVFRFGPFGLDTGAHLLSRGEARIAIQEQPFQVLLALLETPGQVVTREALRIRLWGTTTFVDFDQSLNSAVRRLRMALEDDSRQPTFVETIPRVGFRLLPAVTVDGPVQPDLPASLVPANLNGATPVLVAEQADVPGSYSAASC